MPRLKKKEVATPPAAAAPEAAALTLTAGRSRRTIKPNRKYLNDSIVSMPPSKTSSRSSSPDDSDLSEDEYRKNARDEEEEEDDDDDEEVVPVKSAAGRKSVAAAAAKKTSLSPGSKPRGRPPKSGKAAVKTEPVKNLRKEVMKKMDLTTLSVGKARVLLTPLKQDPKRKLNLDETVEKGEEWGLGRGRGTVLTMICFYRKTNPENSGGGKGGKTAGNRQAKGRGKATRTGEGSAGGGCPRAG